MFADDVSCSFDTVVLLQRLIDLIAEFRKSIVFQNGGKVRQTVKW